jgi:hypothetical protein
VAPCSAARPGGRWAKADYLQLGFIIPSLGGFLLAFLVLDALGVIGNHYVLTHPWQALFTDFYRFSILVLLWLSYCFYRSLDTIPGWRLRKDFQSSWGLVGVERGCGYIRHGI